MKCFCGGRGWVCEKKNDWWVWCPMCGGRGDLSWSRIAKIAGCSVATLKKIDLCIPVRASKSLAVIDRLNTAYQGIKR